MNKKKTKKVKARKRETVNNEFKENLKIEEKRTRALNAENHHLLLQIEELNQKLRQSNNRVSALNDTFCNGNFSELVALKIKLQDKNKKMADFVLNILKNSRDTLKGLLDHLNLILGNIPKKSALYKKTKNLINAHSHLIRSDEDLKKILFVNDIS